MKEGVFLYVEFDDDYGRPVVLRSTHQPGIESMIMVGVDGIHVISELPPGHRLIPLLAITHRRLAALKQALASVQLVWGLQSDNSVEEDVMNILGAMVKECEE